VSGMPDMPVLGLGSKLGKSMKAMARKAIWILQGAAVCVMVLALGVLWDSHLGSTAVHRAPTAVLSQSPQDPSQTTTPAPPNVSSSKTTDSTKQDFTLPRGVELFDGLKSGMTFYDFNAWYTKRAGGPPACSGNYQLHPDGSEYTCSAVSDMDGIKLMVTFHFALDELWIVSGNFDPRDFSSMRTTFLKNFGDPKFDGACDDPNYRDKLGPREMSQMRQSGGCESFIWQSTDRMVILSQIPTGSGERFSIMASSDLSESSPQ